MIVMMTINIAVAANFYCYAQTSGQNPAFSRQNMSQTHVVFQDYFIVRVSADEAGRELQRVFGQRPISVDYDAQQNRLLIWASESEHVQIRHLLQQAQILGLPTKNPPGSDFASFVRRLQMRQNYENSVAAFHSGERFANYHQMPGDARNNIPAVWRQQSNTNRQNEQNRPIAVDSRIRQVSGYAQEQPPIRLPEISSPPNNRRSINVGLRNINAATFEQKLRVSLESRKIVPTQTQNTSGFAQYRIPTLGGQFIDLAIDHSQNIVSIAGQSAAVEAFANVVTMFDGNPKENASVVFVSPSNEAKVRDVAQVMNQVSQLGNAQPGTTVTIPPTNTPSLSNGTELRFVAPNQSTGNAGNSVASLAPPDVTGIIGPINVTILDGGVVVITGPNAREVELVKSLIEYITLVSKEYEPILELVPMIHADCNRVAVVLQQLYPQLYGTSRGEISITPLFRPNTILLIGYQGSIDAAKELIAKLDAPVDAESQFQVFRLKHATAADVKTTLDAFYQGRNSTTTAGTGTANTLAPGLASTVTVVSDYRTNSVVVQAAPRDLVEIAAMVMKLDLPGNEVNTQVKIIPLRNTRAEDMASVVMQALTGRTSTTGGVGGGATQQTGERSSGLQFTTIDASKGERVLNAGIFTDVRVVADTNGNKLIVTAPTECLPLIEAVVNNLDVPPLAKAQIKVFTIINSDVTTLLTMLQNIFTTTQQTGGTNSVASYSMGESSENSVLVPVRFASDSRTNSIVAVGSEDMLAMVEAILLTLDEPELQNRRMMIYKLLNTEASTIASSLQTFLQNERQLRQQAQVGVGEYDLFNSEIIITAESSTNSLMVSTTPRYFEQLRKMIQVLDERPPMVQIQVVIAEIDISSMNEFGIELGLQDSILFDRSVLNSGDFQTINTVTQSVGGGSNVQNQQIISQSTRPGYNFNDLSLPLGNNTARTASDPSRVGSQGITNFAVGRQSSDGAGGFVFSASSESISVLVRALEENQRLTVLNRPMLNVLHNQTATLQVGQLVPTITSANIDSVSGNQTNQVTNQEVGIGLQVTPRISLDDTIALQIQAQKSSMDAEANGTPIFVQGGQVVRSPRINSTSINTVISTKSGQVAVLGGLISQEDQSTRRAVPYVSRIPLVGQLFQYNYKNSTRKEVIFIFIPRVYRTEEEADAIKNLEFARMHWCAAHVAALIDTNDVKTRFDDFNSSETVIERGSDVLLNEHERPTDSNVIDNATQQNVTFPKPVMAPPAPKK
ncbi:MAG: hypothetical protein LBT05_04395 [Planctomycetaceae bacterium]|nr:hypothetical protein [Planctomycetaceae bacterium]